VPSEIALPAGTFLRVRINEKLSSDHNQPGDFFTATLVQPLVANGLVIAQPGQNIAGRVSEATSAKHGNGTSRLGLELTELSLGTGSKYPSGRSSSNTSAEIRTDGIPVWCSEPPQPEQPLAPPRAAE